MSANTEKSLRLRGALTLAAGALLGAVALAQAAQLSRLNTDGRLAAARAEARAETRALRCRLELSRAMLDLNGAAMRRALDELVAESGSRLAWAELLEPDGRRIAATAGAREPSRSDLDPERLGDSGDRPVLRPLEGGGLLAVEPVAVGGRRLLLALGLAETDAGDDWAPLVAVIKANLLALGSAALMLLARGAVDVLAARKASRPAG